MNLDPKWWIVVVPMVIGLLSAGQTIQSRQGIDFLAALTTGWGFVYWLSRGLVPVGTYIAWYFIQNPQEHSVVAAALCGLGSEALLRTKVYLGQTKTAGGNPEDVFKGLFDLIEWYQAYCLKRSGISLAERRRKLVGKLLTSKTDFPTFSAAVKASAASLDDNEKSEVRKKADELLAEFQKQLAVTAVGDETTRLHRDFIFELGYTLLKLVGKRGLKTLTTG